MSLYDSYGNYTPTLIPPETQKSYVTPSSGGIPVFENAKQFATGSGRMGELYGNNSSNAEVYVILSDTADGTAPAAGDKALFVVTVPLAGFVTIEQQRGKQFSRGLYAKAFTDPQLTTPAGNVMSWDVEWSTF